MVACVLKVEPTAFMCTICAEGDEQVVAEPDLFNDILRYQEENNSVIFGDFVGGPQYIVELCAGGHTLCARCTNTLRLNADPYYSHLLPTCPHCRSLLIHQNVARTLPVFIPTPSDNLVIAQENIKHNLIAQHTVLVALHPPTAQEKQADDEVQKQLLDNALLPPLLQSQPLALALQHEDDLHRDYLNDATASQTYFQLLLAQMQPIHHHTAEMDATNALLNVLPVYSQHIENVAHSQMQLDLCNKRLCRLQNARPHPSYVDRLLERDPQWRQRTVPNHGLPAPTY